MSWKSGKSGGRESRGAGGGWSGAGSSRDKPTHRWQDATGASDGQRTHRRQRYRWVFTAVLALVLLGVLIWLLIPIPKTQLIVFTATEYAPPIPLNSWADEDRGTLAELHRANLLLIDESDQWNKDRSTKIEFDSDAIKRNQGRKNAPLIVYLSMHGIVDGDGQPSLLPPGASIRDDKSWIPVARVLKEVRQAVPAKRDTLVILDCSRVRVNWNLGILYNTFVERVQQLVDDEKSSLGGLAVIVAAGPGQTTWASADLGGSAFARYLQLGLAGAADEGETGDGDDSVSVQELASYLAREVSAWSRFNRGEPQTPVLMPKEAEDFHLTWALPSRKQNNLAEQLEKQERSEPAVSPGAIGALWTKLDEQRANDLVRFDPIACRNLEHDLARLEELSNGGSAYKKQATDELARLEEKFANAVEQAKAGDTHRRALVSHLAITSDASWARVPRAAHTLPASEYFGASGSGQTKQIEDLWKTLIDPGDATAKSIIEQSGERELARKLAETQLLAAVRQQDVPSLWRKLDLQQVLERRKRAEELAVPYVRKGLPGDERAHYYARFAAKDADEKRRLAEDSLFVGEQNGLTQYETYAAQADELYKATSEVMDEASTAFNTLDRAWAETPYLAEWLCSPLAGDVAGQDDRVNSGLVPLVQSTWALSEEVNRIKESGEAGLAFRDQASRVSADFATLKGEFEKATDRLSKGDAQGPEGWREIDAALLAPLVSGDTREQLLTNRADISKALHQEYFAATDQEDATNDDAADDDAAPNYLEVMAEWSTHPLLAILPFENADVEKVAERRLTWCERAAADVRNRLQSRIASSQADEAAPSTSAGPELQERQRLSRTEQMLRAMAPLGHDYSDRTSDPIAELRRFDIQQLLIWHGRRAIEDFWEDVANPLAERPFFEQAAQDFLQAASVVREDAGPAVNQQVKLLQQSLEKRLQARQERMQISADPQLAIDPAAPVSVSLTVGTNSLPRDYPPGIAALYLRDAAQRLTAAQFAERPGGKNGFVELPSNGSSPQRFKLTVRNASSMGPTLNAVAFFRGREVAERFNLRMRGGIRVDYKPHQYQDQSITLIGKRQQQTSIIFILDCSYSMKDETFVEGGERGQGETKERMELAKDALGEMLDEIASRNRHGEDTRVGVRFYGHRAVWTRANPPRKLFQTDWGPIPNNLAPSQDVEIIRHLGVFDDTTAGEVRDKLVAVKAWGQTPLYLALEQALDGFDTDEPSTEKLIVAITDGQNEQYEPAGTVGVPPETTKNDVVAKWKNKQVPIHILGFAIAAGAAQAARVEFLDFARQTGGSYGEASSGGELLAKLKERLGVGGYSVREGPVQPATAAERGEEIEAALNAPVSIVNVNPPPKEFTVSFRSAAKSVMLEGGEALQLRVAQERATHDIWAVPYGQPVAAEPVRLVAGARGRPTDYVLRVHKPSRAKSSVSFPISIQMMPTERHHFTGRPTETWLEVTPLTVDGDIEESYVFYDRNFEEHTAVPVLRWTALDWPDTADRARIRFWCKFNKTPGKSLPDVMRAGGKIGGVDLSAKATTENGLYHIHVVERHASPSPGIDSLRVQFEADSRIYADRVTHEFDSRNGIATHSFYLSPEIKARLDQPAASRILVTEAEGVKDGALQLPQGDGIEVSIEDAGELLSPSASAGEQ